MTGIIQSLLMGYGGAAAAATDADFEYVTLLLPGNGTNGAQNNTFLDSSTNNFTITRNGNTTQGTFTPYGSNWSNYFDGTGDYLSVAANAAFQFGTGNFTIEFWYYPTSFGTNTPIDMGYANVGSYAIQSASDGKPYFYSGTTGVVFTATTGYTLNAWNHLAVSRSGTTLSMFINGVRVGTATNSTNFNANFALGIGGSPTHSTPYEVVGYMSNVRLVKGTAIYDSTQSTITVPTAPLTAVTNTSLLTCQSNRFIDNSTNAFAITVNGNTSVQRFSPFSPTAAYASGTIGGSGYFDGTGDWLTNSSDITLNADFCLEAYLYITTLSGTKIVFSSKTDTNVQIPRIQTNGGVYVYINGTELNAGGTATDLGTLNQWNHFALTRSGSTVRAFVNGVQIWSTTYSSSFGVGVVGQFYLSGSPFGGGYDYAGYMASVRVVKGSAVYTSNFTPPTVPLTAITNTQLLLNMTNAGIIDNAMMNDLETVGNAQISTSVSKFGGGSMYFDGTGDYLVVGNMSTNPNLALGSGDFTIEYWYYPLNTNIHATLNNLDDNAGTGSLWILMNGTFSGGSKVQFGYNTGSISNILFGTGTFTTNQWYHIAITRQGSAMRCFINGVQEGATNTGIGTGSIQAFNRNLVIGATLSAGSYTAYNLNGYLDDFRLTKGVARYTANFTAPTAPFPTS